MAVIKPEELAIAAHIEHLPGLSKVLMELLKLNEINDVYDQIADYQQLEFLDMLLKTMSLQIEVSDEDLKKIPKTGAFIAVANHPFGGIDGIILLKLLAEVRPDVKLMVNFILNKIANLQPYFISVNPFEESEDRSNLSGVKDVLSHLKNGSPVAIFPAGEVSSFDLKTKRVTDRQWNPVAGKIISKAEVPVLPIYFKGNNSLLFQMVSLIHPKLRLARLPFEFLRKRRKKIQLKIGAPITVDEIKAFATPQQALNYARARTYALNMGIESRKINILKGRRFIKIKTQSEIVKPADTDLIIDEIMANQDCLITKEADYEIYNCPAFKIPNILHEIGRLREITFREIGEGSGKEIDLDHYDVYYNHLFIWHRPSRQIIGAYRLGIGKNILINRSHQAFYIAELFQIEGGFYPVLEGGIELGRAWIVKDFQTKPLPLFLLWRSLLTIVIRDPNINYLFGPVSISNEYSKFSKALIVEFIKKYYFNDELAAFINPRKAFKPRKLNKEELDILSDAGNNIKNMDAIVGDIEKIHKKVPVLLRKYFTINGRIAGFSIDTEFSNTLDGLLVLELKDIPQSLVDKLSGDKKE